MFRATSFLGTLVPLLSSLSGGAAPVPAAPYQSPAAFILGLEAFEDSSRQLTVEQVDLRADHELPRVDLKDLNLGYRRNAYWVRFRVLNAGRESGHWFLEVPPGADEGTFYTRTAEGFVGRAAGHMLPLSGREVPSERVFLHIVLAPGESRAYWLRVLSDGSLNLGLRLWTPEDLVVQTSSMNLIYGLYYGILLAMLVFNLFLYLYVRDRTYLFYAMFQLGMVLTMASVDQVTYRYLWPEHPPWGTHAEIVFAALLLLGALGFARCFLGLSAVAPRFNRFLATLMCAAGALGGVGAATSHQAVQQGGVVLVVICAAAIFIAGVMAWMRKAPFAQIFVWAWVALFTGAFLWGISVNGLLGAWAGTWAPRAGSLTEAVLLSLGLAQRFRMLRREHQRAHEELLQERTAQARTLEVRVKERTRELSQALEQLRSAQTRMVQQARFASLGHLVAGVAHEIGNPLNFARGGAQDLERRLHALEGALRAQEAADAGLQGVPKVLDGAQRALKLVQSGNERIHRIVENLRLYARSRSVASESMSLPAELEATLSLVSKRLDEHGIRVHADLAPLPEVLCRPGELGQVFLNLLINSAQAMPQGGEIFIAGRCVEGGVELTFRDTGPGIPVEHREAIFDPFFTTRAPSEGTGLGLSISHEIVARHGGELRLVSGEGGATFSITLPLGAPNPAEPWGSSVGGRP